MIFCKKCKKEIPKGSVFCCYCGKKQTSTRRKGTHKRANGTGTIHKDMRYKKPYIALAPADYNGNRLYIGAYPTYADAQKALIEYEQNGKPQLINATFDDIYKLWSETHFKTISDNSQNLYRYMYKHYEPLYKKKIADLRTPDFQIIVDTAKSKPAADALKTIAYAVSRYALENDVIQKNYAEFVKIPKFDKSEKVIFTDAQISELWKHTDDFRIQVILVMIYTGFRIGEIAQIKPCDINFEQGYIIGGEKTEAGKNRIVPFPENVPEIEQFVKNWCKGTEPTECIFKNYTVPQFRSLIFYDSLIEIGMIKGRNIKGNRYEFDKKNHLTPHSTRHTFASLSAKAGMRPEILQKIIGHADYSTTAETYIHKDIEQLRTESAKLHK